MICDRMHDRLLVSLYLVATYTLAHPLIGQTPTYLLATASSMHYIYDVMLGGGLFVSG